jgi:hypothetical protein
MGEGAFQTRVPLTIHLMAFKKTYMVTLIRFGYLHNPPLYIIFQTQMHSTNSRSIYTHGLGISKCKLGGFLLIRHAIELNTHR